MHGNYTNRLNHTKDDAVKAADSPSMNSVTRQPIAIPSVPAAEQPAVAEKKVTFGVVSECNMLNIRTKPDTNAGIAAIVPAGDTLRIDGSDGSFFKVCTAIGIEGYCMKKYVKIEG